MSAVKMCSKPLMRFCTRSPCHNILSLDQREKDSGIISVIKIEQHIDIIYFCKIE